MIRASPQNVGECIIDSAKYPNEYLTFDILNQQDQNNVYTFQSVTIQNEDAIKWELIQQDYDLEVYFFRHKITGKYLCADKEADRHSEHSVQLIDIPNIDKMLNLNECKWIINRHISKSGEPCQVINNVLYDQNLAAGQSVKVNSIKSKRIVYLSNKPHITEDLKWRLEFST